MSPETRTTPPGRHVALYDGECIFCTEGARRLAALAPPGAIELRSFHVPGALDAFPGVTYEACLRAMHLVTPDGRVYRGAESIVQALATRPTLGALAKVYYVPGLRQLTDLCYAIVARYRYRIMGKRIERGECTTACAVHFKNKKPEKEPTP